MQTTLHPTPLAAVTDAAANGRRGADGPYSELSYSCEDQIAPPVTKDPFFLVLDGILRQEEAIRAVRRDRFRQLRQAPCWSPYIQRNELRAARRDHSQSIARTVAELTRAKLWSRGTL